MLVKVKLHGKGTREDPLEVSLPHYRHIHGNVTQGYAIVDIPEYAHPFKLADLEAHKGDETTEGQLYILTDEHIKQLHAQFDKDYAEHKGEYKFEQVK